MAERRDIKHRFRRASTFILRTILLGLALLPVSSALAANCKSIFPDKWIDGTAANEPVMQVQRYDPNTFVIRQSIRTNFEAPFLFLLFGNDKALLLDTGAEGLNIRPTIDRVIGEWLNENHRSSIPLVVAHSHNHRDHRAGDSDFADRPDTTLVGLSVEEVAKFFRVRDWPNDIGHLDLGHRMLDIIPTPGHQNAHIMIYDQTTRLLLSGDAFYPGRLTIPINHWPAEQASIDRIVAFTRTHPVSHILGAHIEMTSAPRIDIPGGAPVHLNERRLELPYRSLLRFQAGIHSMHGMLVRKVYPDFIIEPVPARPD